MKTFICISLLLSLIISSICVFNGYKQYAILFLCYAIIFKLQLNDNKRIK